MARLLLVDGHAYAYRAYYAIRSLSGPDGQPTNAIFGFVKMLDKMQVRLRPTHLLVVWDGGLSTARTEALPEYKAQRPAMPEDLGRQLSDIQRYLQAARVSSFCGPGIEADDYIAGVAEQAVAAGLEVVIASADKDFMQLVRPRLGLLNPNDKAEQVWGEAEVIAKSGVRPDQIVDWLSLVGDAVDNIPGVPGVGVKTAANLLSEFGSIAELYARLESVSSERLRAALRTAELLVRRNQELVRLSGGVVSAGGVDWAALQVSVPDYVRLSELFAEWGFRSLQAEAARKCGGQQELI